MSRRKHKIWIPLLLEANFEKSSATNAQQLWLPDMRKSCSRCSQSHISRKTLWKQLSSPGSSTCEKFALAAAGNRFSRKHTRIRQDQTIEKAAPAAAGTLFSRFLRGAALPGMKLQNCSRCSGKRISGQGHCPTPELLGTPQVPRPGTGSYS